MHDKHNTEEALNASSVCVYYAPNYTFDLKVVSIYSVTPGLTPVFWKGQIVSVSFMGHTEPAGLVQLDRFTVKAAEMAHTAASVSLPPKL